MVRELLIPWREAAKLAGSYGLKYGRHLHPVTGRVHGDFKLSATAAGRMSCSNPNVQQVPRERRFRELFRAPAGRKLVIADYSMAELRVAAMLAGEEKMLGMFQRGEDVHRLTAAALLGKPADEVTKDERQLAKAVNFGLLFGQQARGLQAYAAAKYGVELTLEDAERYRRAWFDTYPGFRRWHTEHGAKTKRDLEVRTICGRVHRWTSWAYRQPGSYSLTEALNTPVQGSAAEALLCALGRLSRALSEGGIDALIINATHDEIVLEASDVDADQAKDVLERSMVAGFTDVFSDAAVNGLVECHVGQSWADK